MYLRGRTTDGAGVCLVEAQKNTTENSTATAPATAIATNELFSETLVMLTGPTLATKGPLATLCRPLHVYTIKEMPRQDHKHKERKLRYAYKTSMRVLAFIWRNRRIFGLPFGVKGDFEYRG